MYGLKEKHIKAINSVFSKYIQIEKVTLYGSRAKGNYRNGSDIDLTLVGDDLDLKTLFKIETKLDDLLLPYKMDLSILRKIENQDLVGHIKRVGITFYLSAESEVDEKMACEWKEVKLGDFFKVKHGYAFKGKHITKEETADILVTPGNFHIGGGFKNSNNKYYNNGDYPESYILKTGDTVVTMTDLSKETDTLGYSAKVPFSKEKKYLHNQRVGLVQFENEDADRDFLYWIMRTREYQGYIIGSASGTSIMHTSPTRIQDYNFLSPSNKEEQKQIAEILTSLDDKIDLLHRQNKTLEAMAETLFREWFVEGAEEDWEEISLYDAIDLIGGGTPKTSIEEYWNGDIKWLAGGDISSNHKSIITSSEKTITEIGLNNSSAKLLPKFSTVISARGTVGKYCILSESMAFSQSNYGIKPKYKDCFFFTYLLINHSVAELQAAAYGSVFDTITTNTFKGYSIALPKEKVIFKFEKMVKGYFFKMINNQTQIQTLENLRDTLLPKLMNGEVKVKSHRDENFVTKETIKTQSSVGAKPKR